MIVFSGYVTFYKNLVTYNKNYSFFFHLVFITKACDCTRYFCIIKKNVPASYLILELLLCIRLCVSSVISFCSLISLNASFFALYFADMSSSMPCE